MESREAFEKWFRKHICNDDYLLRISDQESFTYREDCTNDLWTGYQAAATYYQPLLDAKDEIINTLKMRHNDNFCSTLGIAAERSEVAALKAQLAEKDAEIARLKESGIYTDNSKAAALLQVENTALKALLEQAREALDVARKEVNAWHSGINTKAGLRNLHKAKVGACFGSSGLISHVLAAINATIGKK